MIRIEMPWPPAALSPNARGHWSKRSKAAKAYRAECFMEMFVLVRKEKPAIPEGRLLLDLEFVPPDARRRDDDNCLAAFKAGRDGIAEALGVDDSRFTTMLRLSESTTKGGKVIVTIKPLGDSGSVP